jgi:hypothetical protein
MSKTYVIGHVNPDTDSIASAMGYAWLLRQRDGVDSVAARAGALNPQSAWVLKQLALEAPVLLTDASPRFESVMQRLDSVRPEAQLVVLVAWRLSLMKMASHTVLLMVTACSNILRKYSGRDLAIRPYAR